MNDAASNTSERKPTRLAFSIIFMCCTGVFVGFMHLQDKYPGRPLQMIKNVFIEGLSFEKAIEALQEGNRIRRKSERNGYVKVVITEGKRKKEKYGTYWVSSPEDISNYCSFSIEDVLATDWVIDQ